MVECVGCTIPPIDTVVTSVDLDKAQSVPRNIGRADCFVYYKTYGSFLIECKTAYVKRAVEQLEESLLFLKSNWQKFINSENLPPNTPFPKNFILFLSKGIGKERFKFEIERTTKRLRIKKDGYQRINNDGFIVVYTGKDIANMKGNLHSFER